MIIVLKSVHKRAGDRSDQETRRDVDMSKRSPRHTCVALRYNIRAVRKQSALLNDKGIGRKVEGGQGRKGGREIEKENK